MAFCNRRALPCQSFIDSGTASAHRGHAPPHCTPNAVSPALACMLQPESIVMQYCITVACRAYTHNIHMNMPRRRVCCSLCRGSCSSLHWMARTAASSRCAPATALCHAVFNAACLRRPCCSSSVVMRCGGRGGLRRGCNGICLELGGHASTQLPKCTLHKPPSVYLHYHFSSYFKFPLSICFSAAGRPPPRTAGPRLASRHSRAARQSCSQQVGGGWCSGVGFNW